MKIDLKSAKKLQTLKGWGTSACWWSQYCKEESTQNEIASLLYGREGLGLNIYRYNIGGGTDENNCRISDPWRRTESFMLFDRETGERRWDFSRDRNAVAMMKKCLALGKIDTLILFANSPHYSQTSTGQASGSLLYSTCNIPKSKYRDFADYFLTVTKHFIDEGLPVKYISPINEPQWRWGGNHVWQEGCHYETEELVEIYSIFAQEIIKRELPVKLYGPESGELLGKTEEYLDALSADEKIMSVLDVFAVHSYHNDNDPESRYDFYNRIVKPRPALRFDMSEWCELPNKSHTKDFKGALITARVIGQDLIYAGFESWTAWVGVNGISIHEDGFDYSDAMISASPDFSKWYIAERYYALAHYTKFIPVGSVALDIGLRPTNDSNAFNAFAFKTPNGKTVLVVVNEKEDGNIELCGEYRSMKMISSTQNKKLACVYSGAFKNSVHSEYNSLLTIILD